MAEEEQAGGIGLAEPEFSYAPPVSEEEEEESSEALAAVSASNSLDSYQILTNDALPELSTKFATAYRALNTQQKAGGELYALVFENAFPAQHEDIAAMREMESPNLSKLHDAGRISVPNIGERYVAFLSQPQGKPLSQIINESNRWDDGFVNRIIIPQIHDALRELHDSDITHGCINPDTVYYSPAGDRVMLKTHIAEFSGFSQYPAYETINRLLCEPIGKGGRDFGADYFALGVLTVFMLVGRTRLSGLKLEDILTRRLTNGSYESTVAGLFDPKVNPIAGRTRHLLKALINDDEETLWQAEEVTGWVNKRFSPPAPATFHKEAIAAFTFDGKEYFNRKYLVYDLFKNWSTARSEIKTFELSRWLKLSLKANTVAERIDTLGDYGSTDALLSDYKLARILIALDPEGPIRFKKYATSIYGVGAFLALGYIEANREYLQFIGDIFNDGLVEHWITTQEDPEDYSYTALLWTPSNVVKFVRKSGIAFGMERCLYYLNPTLPCQSAMFKDSYITALPQLLSALETKSSSRGKDSDPMDRHIAAFIGEKIELSEDVRVKSVQRFTNLHKNTHITMLALLTVAQSHTNLSTLPGLTNWLKDRLLLISEELHSVGLSNDFKRKLDAASKDGDLHSLFKYISNPIFATRDQNGFKEARMQYRMLENEINNMSSHRTIERLSYHYGLRFSLMMSYIILVTTLVILVARIA